MRNEVLKMMKALLMSFTGGAIIGAGMSLVCKAYTDWRDE